MNKQLVHLFAFLPVAGLLSDPAMASQSRFRQEAITAGLSNFLHPFTARRDIPLVGPVLQRDKALARLLETPEAQRLGLQLKALLAGRFLDLDGSRPGVPKKLPFDDNALDAVFGRGVMEDAAVVAELGRALRPGGVLLLDYEGPHWLMESIFENRGFKAHLLNGGWRGYIFIKIKPVEHPELLTSA